MEFLCKDKGLFGEILVSQSPQIKSSGRFFLLKVREVLIQSVIILLQSTTIITKCDRI